MKRDRGRVLEAIKHSTFNDKLSELENGIDTVLTRGFDEKRTNLAGVKARQLAIARVFAENYDLIILMSRLSSLDPIAEYELYKQIAELLLIKLLYLYRIVCQPCVMPILFIYLRTAE